MGPGPEVQALGTKDRLQEILQPEIVNPNRMDLSLSSQIQEHCNPTLNAFGTHQGLDLLALNPQPRQSHPELTRKVSNLDDRRQKSL